MRRGKLLTRRLDQLIKGPTCIDRGKQFNEDMRENAENKIKGRSGLNS